MILNVFNQEIKGFEKNDISLFLKREDLIHPYVSGNKYRKLKYNLAQAKKENYTTLLTFGGAYSNHIAALAFAGKEAGFKTIGVIRGEELATKIQDNPTLTFAQKCGMTFLFETRANYRNKNEIAYLHQLIEKFGSFYLIPEGGTNEFAIKGCEEILTPEDKVFDYICCSVGTGGTIAGIINSSNSNQNVLGFPALKGDFLKQEIQQMVQKDNWELNSDYHFGGYAKVSPELILFINSFYENTKILLDPVYTAKLLFGIINLINQGYFPNGSKILAIHTGGIQGIQGMNIKLEDLHLPKIKYDV
jgi:1-aminocyclopropane-1-carboxylate deaminase